MHINKIRAKCFALKALLYRHREGRLLEVAVHPKNMHLFSVHDTINTNALFNSDKIIQNRYRMMVQYGEYFFKE